MFRKKAQNYLNDEDGSTAVEFGLVALAFVALLFSIIEAGRLFLAWNGFQYAVENAARTAMVDADATEADVESLVDDQLADFLMDAGNATLQVTFPESGGINFIEIEGTYTYSSIVPFLPDSWDTFTLTAKSRLARPDSGS